MSYDSIELKEPSFAVIEDNVLKKLVFRKNDGELLEVGVGVDSILSGTFAGDAYTVTKGALTYTQPAVTRDASTGAITVRPAITVA